MAKSPSPSKIAKGSLEEEKKNSSERIELNNDDLIVSHPISSWDDF